MELLFYLHISSYHCFLRVYAISLTIQLMLIIEMKLSPV